MSTLIRLRKKKDEFSGQGVYQQEESEELCSDDGKVRLFVRTVNINIDYNPYLTCFFLIIIIRCLQINLQNSIFLDGYL